MFFLIMSQHQQRLPTIETTFVIDKLMIRILSIQPSLMPAATQMYPDELLKIISYNLKN